MPDITMCANQDCQKRLQCYRAMATPSEYRQSLSMFDPDNTGKCDSFGSMKREEDDETV